jgi:hypothetical protein
VIVEYIERSYNRKRLYQELGYCTPLVVEGEATGA